MEQIRSFIAIELPQEVRQAFTRLQEKLKAGGGAPVKWVDAGNVHLTLKFLGNVDAAITGRIISAIEEAARGMHPFHLDLGGLGVFPSIRRVQVVWVGLTGELEKLVQLQKSIEAKLVPLGFPAEARSFTPHLTLGRVRDYIRPEERQALGQLIERAVFEAKYKISVAAIHLMESQLTREGPIYSRLGTVELK